MSNTLQDVILAYSRTEPLYGAGMDFIDAMPAIQAPRGAPRPPGITLPPSPGF